MCRAAVSLVLVLHVVCAVWVLIHLEVVQVNSKRLQEHIPQILQSTNHFSLHLLELLSLELFQLTDFLPDLGLGWLQLCHLFAVRQRLLIVFILLVQQHPLVISLHVRWVQFNCIR